jgi:hypothetical protein
LAAADLSKTYGGRGICAVHRMRQVGSFPKMVCRKVPLPRCADDCFNLIRRDRSIPMMDVLMIAFGVGFFVAAVGYTYACERL